MRESLNQYRILFSYIGYMISLFHFVLFKGMQAFESILIKVIDTLADS